MDYASGMRAASNPLLAACVASVRIPLNKWERLAWAKDRCCAQDARMTILEGLGQLPEVSSAVLNARYGEGLTLAEYGRRIERSRERVRQLEAKALRLLRGELLTEMSNLRKALVIEPVPGGPFDPAWVTTAQAAELTELTADHIRYLCRAGKVDCKPYVHKMSWLAINRASLKAYVLGRARNGRRRGVWKGD